MAAMQLFADKELDSEEATSICGLFPRSGGGNALHPNPLLSASQTLPAVVSHHRLGRPSGLRRVCLGEPSVLHANHQKMTTCGLARWLGRAP
jgi:hypothetical protein